MRVYTHARSRACTRENFRGSPMAKTVDLELGPENLFGSVGSICFSVSITAVPGHSFVLIEQSRDQRGGLPLLVNVAAAATMVWDDILLQRDPESCTFACRVEPGSVDLVIFEEAPQMTIGADGLPAGYAGKFGSPLWRRLCLNEFSAFGIVENA